MKKVLVIYHSQEFGNTEACAKLVAQGVRAAGALEVEMINTNVAQRVEMKVLAAADGVAIGSPDYYGYVAGTIKQLFDDLYIAAKGGMVFKGKPCVLFMTHGGGGAGIKSLRALSRSLAVLAEPFVCEGSPVEGCPDAVELGKLLGRRVLGT